MMARSPLLPSCPSYNNLLRAGLVNLICIIFARAHVANSTPEKKPMRSYIITDGNGTETASTLTDAAEICERWYDSMQASGLLAVIPPPDLDGSSLAALNVSIAKWEQEIAAQCGKKDFKLRVAIDEP
jgi:hypothetical protein